MESIQWFNVCLSVVLVGMIVYQSQYNKKLTEVTGTFEYITAPLTLPTDETEASRKLKEYTKNEFLNARIVKVKDNVHVAIGYAIANSIMVEGEDGLIIIDATENLESMKEILREFRKITTKPVKAVILTHFHADHLLGTNAILEEGKRLYPEQKIDIYCHEMTLKMMSEFSSVAFKRAVRQFGTMLPLTKTGSGLGLLLKIAANSDIQVPVPTVEYKENATFVVAGLTFQLLHTPGETDDQTSVWFPDDKVLMTGDNIYRTFPNLYAIRGSKSRDNVKWYKSLDKVRELGAEYLVPSHTRPIIGKDAIYDTLLVYRDAIKFIHDQTIRYLDMGLFPDEIVPKVKLPDSLAAHPYLQEHYGTVEWTVRGIFDHYLGWFSGDPADMYPLDPNERAARFVALLSHPNQSTDGEENLVKEAQKALVRSRKNYESSGKHIANDDKWALELADIVLKTAIPGSKFEHVATQIKISALTALGVESVSANGRNYYLTVATETEKKLEIKRPKEAQARFIKTAPIKILLEKMCLKANGLQCQHNNYTIRYEFSDLNETYSMTLRNSVCDVIKGTATPKGLSDVVILSLTSQTFKSILTREAGIETLTSITVKEGSRFSLWGFFKCFERDD